MFKKFSFLLCLVFVLGIAGIGINAAESRETTPFEVATTGSYVHYSGDNSVKVAMKIDAMVVYSTSGNYFTTTSGSFVKNIRNSSYALVDYVVPYKTSNSRTDVTWTGTVQVRRLNKSYGLLSPSARIIASQC